MRLGFRSTTSAPATEAVVPLSDAKRDGAPRWVWTPPCAVVHLSARMSGRDCPAGRGSLRSPPGVSMIKISCPGCGRALNVPDNAAGRTGRCPSCKASVKIPQRDSSTVELEDDPSPVAPPRPAATASPPPMRPATRPSNSLGIASLVLGSIAFLICWIPFLGLLGMPLSILGAILGGVGLVAAIRRSGLGIGFPIAGTAVSALSLIVCAVITTAFTRAVEETGKSRARAQETNQTVVGKKPGVAAANEPDPPARPSPQPPPQPEEQWASAKEAVQQGDIRIRVKRVAVQKIPLSSLGQSSQSEDDLLAVYLQVTNASKTKKADYLTWRGKPISIERDSATLQDNFENVLKRINFGFGTEVVGGVQSTESIYPGKEVEDVLVFEAPIDATEYVRLELPAANFGGTGNIRLQIPNDMIER